jgi:hypothetical protein
MHPNRTVGADTLHMAEFGELLSDETKTLILFRLVCVGIPTQADIEL